MLGPLGVGRVGRPADVEFLAGLAVAVDVDVLLGADELQPAPGFLGGEVLQLAVGVPARRGVEVARVVAGEPGDQGAAVSA